MLKGVIDFGLVIRANLLPQESYALHNYVICGRAQQAKLKCAPYNKASTLGRGGVCHNALLWLAFCSLCLQKQHIGFSLLIITLAVIFHLLPSSSAYAMTSPPIDYAAVVPEPSISLKSPYSQHPIDRWGERWRASHDSDFYQEREC
jgi:hypothetical protein